MFIILKVNEFPDILVGKDELISKYFPTFSKKTLEKYMTAIGKNKEFRGILLRPSTKMTLINVKGFYEYLRWCEANRFK